MSLSKTKETDNSNQEQELNQQLNEVNINSNGYEGIVSNPTEESKCVSDQATFPTPSLKKAAAFHLPDHESEVLEIRPYLQFLQYEIPKKYNNLIIIIVYNLTKKVQNTCFEVASYLKDDKFKEQYIEYISNWADHVHKEAEKLFSCEDVTPFIDTSYPEIDLESITGDFRNDSVLAHSVLLQFLIVLLQAGNYPGITRSFLLQIRALFDIKYPCFIEQLELPLSQDLLSSNSSSDKLDVEKERKDRQDKSRVSQWTWTSLGAVGGGVALAVSGGLAAPLVLPYMGSLLGASALLAGTSGLAIVTSIFGATGAGLTGYKISKRTASIKDFGFLPLTKNKQQQFKALHATICVSGWLLEEHDLLEPWSSLFDGDGFAVRFETSTLLEIGIALKSLFATQMVGYAASEVLKKTVISGLVSAIAWPMALLQAGSIIDNPWSIGLDRADKAGKIMADALINRAQGRRPVTLVGFSLGGRAVFSCLQELLARSSKDISILDIVENAFIIGAPVTTSRKEWLSIKTLVPGRLVNGFSSSDWILSFLHRAYSYGRLVAGNSDLHKFWGTRLLEKNKKELNETSTNSLQPDKSSPNTSIVSQEPNLSDSSQLGIESIDFSGIISGHLDYIKAMPKILSLLGFSTSIQDSNYQLSDTVQLAKAL